MGPRLSANQRCEMKQCRCNSFNRQQRIPSRSGGGPKPSEPRVTALMLVLLMGRDGFC